MTNAQPRTRRLGGVLRLIVAAVLIAVCVESGYRLYLFLKHRDYFRTTEIDEAGFSVWSTSVWQYDPDYGYGYVPSLKVDVTHLGGGLVTNCTEMALANEQGNFGPPVPDFDEAEIRIVIFGDSFTGASVTGPAWT